jgi:antitoxin (DNA-binding transcriptional repressor) of toxin-antitoxin stability system
LEEVYGKMSDMKIVSIREISRHFTKHAELSREGENIRVYRAGKPYVRIVPDDEAPPASVPKVDFGARAREDFGRRPPKTDVVKQIIRNRR